MYIKNVLFSRLVALNEIAVCLFDHPIWPKLVLGLSMKLLTKKFVDKGFFFFFLFYFFLPFLQYFTAKITLILYSALGQT